jgi:phosphatidylserine/phosphatidylglycerophosphate/cardiolipin synthase-like enzyme
MRALIALVFFLLPAGFADAAGMQVCFTPGEDCTAVITAEIAAARREVRVQAYGFTSRPIAEALVGAERRGVDVKVILDERASHWRAEREPIARLRGAGIEVRLDGDHAIAHNKVMIIDGATVLTGSFNFTAAAQFRNAENLLVVHDPALAGRYLANWRFHAAHSPAIGAGLAEVWPTR